MSCDNEDCREPHGAKAYVFEEDTNDTFCLRCYLIFRCFMDPLEAEDIVFEPTIKNH
jgi:hypothetical protein